MTDTFQPVRRYGINTLGRDFVVGDIHGCYDELWAALKEARFHPERDRLFSVGDLVDRGPGSERVERFLDQPWVFAVRGNHEDEILNLYEDGVPHHDVLQAYMNMVGYRNGLGWWMAVPYEQRLRIVEKLRRLPLVMELETSRGKVGLLHAEVPQRMDWATFIACIEAGDEKVLNSALWGRERYHADDHSGVSGIDRVFVGHTPRKLAERKGNVYYVDTGAFKQVLEPGRQGHLTMANVLTATQVLSSAAPAVGRPIMVLNEPVQPQQHFGNYAAG
ncbi:metallophosphoesterase [Paraburkholderia sp. EG287A]|uniref:metallophosphoesterase n=1 Tax=Paraburkholderia sp. EG287A TaxID=3237012 RepID=UPI0034D2D3C6